MNRLRTYTTRPQNKQHVPLKIQKSVEQKNESASSLSSSRQKKLNIVTQDVIEEYLQKMDLDMNDENDSEVIIKLLKKPNKNLNDIEIIMKVFSKISFFQDLQKKIPLAHIRHLIKQFNYEFKERGDVVFQFDEHGTNYYILLKGSLFLLVPKDTLNVDYTPEKQYVASQYLTEPIIPAINNVIKIKQFDDNDYKSENRGTPKTDRSLLGSQNNSKTERMNTPKSLLSRNRNSHVSPSQKRNFSKFNEDFFKRKSIIPDNIVRDPEKELILNIKTSFPDFEIIKKLEAVTGFGEIALMSNLKRTATIVCRERSHLVTLSKSNYEKILKEHHENIVQSKINFLKNYSFFSEWNRSKMLSLWELLKLHSFPKNSLIYKEGDEAKSFFFIKEGEVEISKIFNFQNESLDLDSYNSKEYYRSSLIDINLVWADSHWKKNVKRIKLALLGQGTYFGEEEVLLPGPRTSRAIVVSASAEIYKCPSEKFFAYVKTLHNLQLLKDDIQMRNEWRETYVESIKEINEFLNKTFPPIEKNQSPRFSNKMEESQRSPINNNSMILDKTFRKRRVATAADKKIDLNSLLFLENLHKRMKSMLKLKKALNVRTDKEQCDDNSKFLNSFLEDHNKKFSILWRNNPGTTKVIGVVKDIFPKRRKSFFEARETSEKQKKRAKSLSINSISFGKLLKGNEQEQEEKKEFKNGRKLKQRLYRALNVKF